MVPAVAQDQKRDTSVGVWRHSGRLSRFISRVTFATRDASILDNLILKIIGAHRISLVLPHSKCVAALGPRRAIHAASAELASVGDTAATTNSRLPIVHSFATSTAAILWNAALPLQALHFHPRPRRIALFRTRQLCIRPARPSRPPLKQLLMVWCAASSQYSRWSQTARAAIQG